MRWETVDLYALAEETVQTLLTEAEAAGVRLALYDVSNSTRPKPYDEFGSTCPELYGESDSIRPELHGESDNARPKSYGEPDSSRLELHGESDSPRPELCGEAGGFPKDMHGKAATIYGIRQMLSVMLYNLCDNAIKYNRRGGSVSVRIKSDEEGMDLSVSDTGIGIPTEHQERIFERFYRVDKSHSKEIGGTGLGLSIVKHGAKLHNAEIEVHSVVGSGTTITLHFPCFHN
ncbi:MAG: hypothetical protein K2O97_04760 [Acetatifactor sp.]|nr:hypothetical protein [Acetatifactor sp.]